MSQKYLLELNVAVSRLVAYGGEVFGQDLATAVAARYALTDALSMAHETCMAALPTDHPARWGPSPMVELGRLLQDPTGNRFMPDPLSAPSTAAATEPMTPAGQGEAGAWWNQVHKAADELYASLVMRPPTGPEAWKGLGAIAEIARGLPAIDKDLALSLRGSGHNETAIQLASMQDAMATCAENAKAEFNRGHASPAAREAQRLYTSRDLPQAQARLTNQLHSADLDTVRLQQVAGDLRLSCTTVAERLQATAHHPAVRPELANQLTMTAGDLLRRSDQLWHVVRERHLISPVLGGEQVRAATDQASFINAYLGGGAAGHAEHPIPAQELGDYRDFAYETVTTIGVLARRADEQVRAGAWLIPNPDRDATDSWIRTTPDQRPERVMQALETAAHGASRYPASRRSEKSSAAQRPGVPSVGASIRHSQNPGSVPKPSASGPSTQERPRQGHGR